MFINKYHIIVMLLKNVKTSMKPIFHKVFALKYKTTNIAKVNTNILMYSNPTIKS